MDREGAKDEGTTLYSDDVDRELNNIPLSLLRTALCSAPVVMVYDRTFSLRMHVIIGLPRRESELYHHPSKLYKRTLLTSAVMCFVICISTK